MKTEKTLKEQLKPPFTFVGGKEGGHILNAENVLIFQFHIPVRFLVWLKHETLSDDSQWLCDFLANALNEKAGRDIAEPKRWRRVWTEAGETWLECPKCLVSPDSCGESCPSCGARLGPPEEIDERERQEQ